MPLHNAHRHACSRRSEVERPGVPSEARVCRLADVLQRRARARPRAPGGVASVRAGAGRGGARRAHARVARAACLHCGRLLGTRSWRPSWQASRCTSSAAGCSAGFRCSADDRGARCSCSSRSSSLECWAPAALSWRTTSSSWLCGAPLRRRRRSARSSGRCPCSSSPQFFAVKRLEGHLALGKLVAAQAQPLGGAASSSKTASCGSVSRRRRGGTRRWQQTACGRFWWRRRSCARNIITRRWSGRVSPRCPMRACPAASTRDL